MEKLLIRGGRVIDPANGVDRVADVLVEDGKIAAVGEGLSAEGASVYDAAGKVVAPGFIDMHCHLRDPGQEYKEDIVSGTRAAAHGGFTAVCGAVSKGLNGVEMAEIGRMKEAGIIAISDDGQPVANSNLFRLAMQYADHFGLFIMSHSEDKNLVGDGVMNEGFISTKLGLPGITRAAEEVMIARDILVAEAEGKRIHLCHVSTRGGVQLVREAKARGVRVTAETTPHYIGATDEWVIGYDSRCRVNPPLREEADRLACIEGLCDGTIDVIATDHAPHHEDEKRCEFHLAASGISGFETAFCISNTMLVKSGRMTLSDLIERMSVRPAKLLGIPGGSLSIGSAADVAVFDPDKEVVVDASKFLSRGKNTPFDGKRYFGEIALTLVGGRTAYQGND